MKKMLLVYSAGCFMLIGLSACTSVGNRKTIQEKTSQSRPAPEQYNDEIAGILATMFDLFSTIESDRKDIHDSFQLVYQAVQGGSIEIRADESMPEDIFGAAAFSFGKIRPAITIASFLLDLYAHRPSLTLAILMHEIYHASSYLTDEQAFRQGLNNYVEYSLYEMDALYAEAYFIKHYLKKTNYSLGAFEEYLVTSFDENSLRQVFVELYGTDIFIIIALNGLHLSIQRNETVREELLKEITRLGGILYKEELPTNNDQKKYSILTSMSTYYRSVPIFLSYYYDRVMQSPEEADIYLAEKYPSIYSYLRDFQYPLSETNVFRAEYRERLQRELSERALK